jgi:GT2 family glycosyltransferase
VGITPQIRYFNPQNKIWNCGGKIIFPGFRKYYYANKHAYLVPTNGYKNITFVTGCALLINVNETGLLSEKFFFGEEDFDLSWRLMKSHKKLACVYESIIYHKVNVSVKKASGNFGGIILLYTQRLINLKEKISKFQWLLYVIIQVTYSIPMMIIRYRFSLRNIVHIWKRICFFTKTNDLVNKDLFYLIIKE